MMRGPAACGPELAYGGSTLFPGIDLRLLTLAVNFYVPFLREYFLALGVNDVSRESCITNLRRGPGVNLAQRTPTCQVSPVHSYECTSACQLNPAHSNVST